MSCSRALARAEASGPQTFTIIAKRVATNAKKTGARRPQFPALTTVEGDQAPRQEPGIRRVGVPEQTHFEIALPEMVGVSTTVTASELDSLLERQAK